MSYLRRLYDERLTRRNWLVYRARTFKSIRVDAYFTRDAIYL